MTKKNALELLINLTNKQFGYTPTTPSEFEELRTQVQSVVGTTISLSSVKRIWGYVKSEGFPSASTLNCLARYVGYPSWHDFMMTDLQSNTDDSEFIMDTAINTESLPLGTRCEVRWGSCKMCRMESLGNKRFRVLDSTNIKLLAGDTLTMHTLCVGMPIYASDIDRGDTRIPAYIGAKKGGITILRIES